ncbi:MAG TPA: ubiquitin-like protein Pup [Methylomirabilota bacterium]|nr:ubiquitin-like protein Pup [Methylomirabilota bacterium]
MTEKVSERRPAPSRARGAEGPRASATITERGAALKKTLDDVLDDIDDVLEANAEEFVKEYVQRGGE